MPHPRGKRSLRSKQLTDARRFILDKSFIDRVRGESVNIVTSAQVTEQLQQKYPYIHQDVLNFTRGEIIIDSRGTGSLQK